MKMGDKKVTVIIELLMEKGDNFYDYELAEILKGNTYIKVLRITTK